MDVPLIRQAGEIEGDFVVFMIGMRINILWKVGTWLPVVRAMPRMLRELARHPEWACVNMPAHRLRQGGPRISGAVQKWVVSSETTCRGLNRVAFLKVHPTHPTSLGMDMDWPQQRGRRQLWKPCKQLNLIGMVRQRC